MNPPPNPSFEVGADRIGWITFDDPDRSLNVLTEPVMRRFGACLDEARAAARERRIGVLVVRSGKPDSFIAGADIDAIAAIDDPAEAEAKIRMGQAVFNDLASLPITTVAAIHGICVGGGLEIAGTCDIRVCGASSRFGAPINKLGLVMGYAELDALIALAGRSTALEILLEGRIFGAAEAKEKGLVTRVVDDAEVENEAMATARRIAEGAPLVARWHKKFAARLAEDRPLTPEELDEGYACYDTEDFRIGYRAFLDKVKPEFKGR